MQNSSSNNFLCGNQNQSQQDGNKGDQQTQKRKAKQKQKYMKLIVYGNAASCSQNCWKIQKCNGICYELQNQFQHVIKKCLNRQTKLSLNRLFVRVKYQHCALLSQLNLHEKALQTSKQSLPILKQNIEIILQYVQTKMQVQQISSNNNIAININKSGQLLQSGIIFRKKICSFAQPILQNLLNLINSLESSTKKLSQSYDGQYMPQNGKNFSNLCGFGNQNTNSNKFYYWQKNPQKNSAQLNKVFLSANNETVTQNAKRSILGVNKQKNWIDEFNIGSVMRMQSYQYKDFEKILPIQEYVFKDKIFQLVVYCSIGFFTIATQLRFLDGQQKQNQALGKSDKHFEQSQIQSTSPYHNKSPVFQKLRQIKKKYGYNSEKNSFKKLSQFYHSQSIYIITQNIKSKIPYLEHIIKSYQKHYIIQKKLQEIQSIAEQSGISSFIQPNAQGKSSNLFSNKKQKNNYQNDSRKSLQYGLQPYQKSNNLEKLQKVNQLLIQSSDSLKDIKYRQKQKITSLTPNCHQFLKFQQKKQRRLKRDKYDRKSLKTNQLKYSDFQIRETNTLGNTLQQFQQQKQKLKKMTSLGKNQEYKRSKRNTLKTANTIKNTNSKSHKEIKNSVNNHMNNKLIQFSSKKAIKFHKAKQENVKELKPQCITKQRPQIINSPVAKYQNHLKQGKKLNLSKSQTKLKNVNYLNSPTSERFQQNDQSNKNSKQFKKKITKTNQLKKASTQNQNQNKSSKNPQTPHYEQDKNFSQSQKRQSCDKNFQFTSNSHDIGLYSKPQVHIKHKSVTEYKFVFKNQ